jgi:protein-arginine kinase activator protein McsA
VKTQTEILQATSVADRLANRTTKEDEHIDELARLHQEMAEAVSLMEFERAAVIRDRIRAIKRSLDHHEGRTYQKETRTQH